MPIFWTDKELEFFKGLNDEIIKNVISHKVLLYRVKREETKENIYGESESKKLEKPIEVYALVDIQNKVEQNNTLYGINTKYNLTCYFQKDYIIENNININIGDFIKYGNIVYEISSYEETKFVFGMPTKSIMFKCDCVSTRENII